MDDDQDQEESNVAPLSVPPSGYTTIKVLTQNGAFSNGSRSQQPSTYPTAPTSRATQQSHTPPKSVLASMTATHQISPTTGRTITGRFTEHPQSNGVATATAPTFYPPNSNLTSKNTRFESPLGSRATTGGYSPPTASKVHSPQETRESLPPPPTVLTSLMTPYQTSGTAQSAHISGTGTIAAPSKSAEEQWLETVVKPSMAKSQPSSYMERQMTCNGSQCSRSRNLTQAPRSEMTSTLITTAHETEDDMCSKQDYLEDPELAHERLSLMQSEVDHVIGVMKMDFGKPCGMGPDKRLSEIYHHCPDYPDYGEKGWRKKQWGSGKEAEEQEKRRQRRYRKQMCVLILFLVFLLLLAGLDYWLFGWFIGRESEELLKEANATKMMMESLKNGTTETGGDARSGEGFLEEDDQRGNESTTGAMITQIEEEDIKAILVGGEGDETGEDENENTATTERSDVNEDDMDLRRGHDVLEPAQQVDDEEQEKTMNEAGEQNEPELLAINMLA